LPTLLDTSVAIALRDGSEPVLRKAAALSEPALLSIVSVVELPGGIVRLAVGKASRAEALAEILSTLDILPFDEADAAAYGSIIAALGFSRTKLIDRMIAAQAIVAGATLATLNPRDFRDIPRLTVEDWSA
jgi:tRNA(fMet)-specific endonuclease VapC